MKNQVPAIGRPVLPFAGPVKVLIVHVHHDPQSMNGSLTALAVETLSAAGAAVRVSDLYAQRFDPVASRRDFLRQANPDRFGYVHEQRHAAANRAFADDILQEQDKVSWADLIVFQFPVWWYGPPAILKGWADRVLSHGFAYADECMFERGLLKGKRGMLSVTTGGSQRELLADSAVTGTIEEFLRPFSGGVLRFVGLEVLDPFVAYAPESIGREDRARQLDEYRQRLLKAASSAAAGSK